MIVCIKIVYRISFKVYYIECDQNDINLLLHLTTCEAEFIESLMEGTTLDLYRVVGIPYDHLDLVIREELLQFFGFTSKTKKFNTVEPQIPTYTIYASNLLGRSRPILRT
jgi:hypothetical protein